MVSNGRELELHSRLEDTRDSRPLPVEFSLEEILSHFTHSLDEIRQQFLVADELLVSGNTIACKIIWRSQIVLVESLLDFYIHELSKFCLTRMFSGDWDKSQKYQKITVPIDDLETALNTADTTTWFFGFLNERLSRDVYLGLENMKNQLNLLGIDFCSVITQAFPDNNQELSLKNGKAFIKQLFQRRNEIVHQNDRSHASAEQADITKDYVENAIYYVDSIVQAIHCIATEKENSLQK